MLASPVEPFAVSPERDRLATEAVSGCIDFLRDLVTLPSPTRGERLACERVKREMERLGYDEVFIDDMGNVIGRFGSGPRVLAFDAHVDTVGISSPTQWRFDPFRGVVSGGTMFGRGAADQKGGLASIVHGAAVAARVGLPAETTLLVTATVHDADCVGLAWRYLIAEVGLQPEAVVIAMPSHLGVCRGQRGRMELELETVGVSTHVTHPERGSNAIYAMAPVVERLARLGESFERTHPLLGSGSLAVTSIGSSAESLTSVPNVCTIHLDRRLTLGETPEEALAQIQQLREVVERDAAVRVLDYALPSWRGLVYPTAKVFPAWETAEDSPAFVAAMATARAVLGRQPRLHRSAFSSNGCTTAGVYHVPTVGFGPADEIHSHTVNDQISLAQLQPAIAFFASYPQAYLEAAATPGA